MTRRTHFFVLATFIIGLLGGQKAFAANTDVVINEIGAYESTGHEWIEIWNKGTEAVDMNNWKLWEEKN